MLLSSSVDEGGPFCKGTTDNGVLCLIVELFFMELDFFKHLAVLN